MWKQLTTRKTNANVITCITRSKVTKLYKLGTNARAFYTKTKRKFSRRNVCTVESIHSTAIWVRINTGILSTCKVVLLCLCTRFSVFRRYLASVLTDLHILCNLVHVHCRTGCGISALRIFFFNFSKNISGKQIRKIFLFTLFSSIFQFYFRKKVKIFFSKFFSNFEKLNFFLKKSKFCDSLSQLGNALKFRNW